MSSRVPVLQGEEARPLVRERAGFLPVHAGPLPADRGRDAAGGSHGRAPDRRGRRWPAARFLYVWPLPGLEAVLDRRPTNPPDVAAMLARLTDLPATLPAPALLPFESGAAEAMQPILPALRGFMQGADGLESAWIGKGPGNIVRLAGLLCLMDWAIEESRSPAPSGVAAAHVERAHALWAEYFWPHAQAVFGQADTTMADRQARRIARWLQRLQPDAVSREDIRRARGALPDGRRADRRGVDRTAGELRRPAAAGVGRRGARRPAQTTLAGQSRALGLSVGELAQLALPRYPLSPAGPSA